MYVTPNVGDGAAYTHTTALESNPVLRDVCVERMGLHKLKVPTTNGVTIVLAG